MLLKGSTYKRANWKINVLTADAFYVGGGQKGSKPDDASTEISFNRYQEMAGNVVRGTTEERIKLLFYLVHKVFGDDTSVPEEGMFGKSYEKPIPASSLVKFVEDVVKAATVLTVKGTISVDAKGGGGLSKAEADSSATLAKSLVKVSHTHILSIINQ